MSRRQPIPPRYRLRLVSAVLALLFGMATRADAYWDEQVLAMEQFSGYKPMYVLLGSPDAKLQLSLKARIIDGWELFFGYSQLMFWDLEADSHPFHDLNYNPSLFYRWRFSQGSGRWIDFGFYEHESNGLAGTGSREWERIYLLVADSEPLGGVFQWHGSFKVWLPFRYDVQNPDLAQYRGLCELNLTLANPFGSFLNGSDLTFRFYPAGRWYFDPTKGGQELTLRLKAWRVPYLPKITLQIFHGYGEYLLDYNQSHWRAYVGFSF